MKLIDFWSWTYMAREARRPLNLDWEKDIFNLGLPPTQTASVSSHTHADRQKHIHSLIYIDTDTDKQTHTKKLTHRKDPPETIRIHGRRTSSIWASHPRKRLLSVPTQTHADRQKQTQWKICTHRQPQAHTQTRTKPDKTSRKSTRESVSIDWIHIRVCLTDKFPAWTPFPTF